MRRTRVRPEVGLELGQLRPAAEEELDVGEAEADAARDGLRRVAADEEAVLIGGRVVQQRQLRHGQVLNLVDDDLVQRRVAPRLRLEVEDLSRSTRVSWMASPFARLPRWQSWEGRQVAHVVQAILLLLLEVLLEGVVRGGPHRGLERRLLAREREVLIAREVA